MSQVATIKGQDIHGNTKVAAIDFITNALEGISTDHAYIHNGYMYAALIGPVSLAAGTVRKVTFLTPSVASGKYIHWRPSLISCSADKLTVTMYEGSSGNSGGTEKTAYNRNRISTKTSVSTIIDGATVTTNGTAIDAFYIGGGTGVGSTTSGSTLGENNELVLKQNTLYTIEIANGSAAANIVFAKLLWYEEDAG